MLFGIPLTVGGILLAGPIIDLVAGPEFAESARSHDLIARDVRRYLGAIFGHMAVAINKQKEAIWIYLSTALLTFAGYLIFIPRYGIYGAAWMSVFSEIYTGLLLFIVIHRYTFVALKLKTLMKILFGTLVMAVALWYFSALPLILLILLGAGIFGATLIVVGGVYMQTIKEIVSPNTSAKTP